MVSYCLIILVVYTQQISAADFLSKSSQQIFSADLSASSQQIFSADHLLWSGVGGQLLSYHLPWSGVGGQLLSYHLLWSGVGGQLLSYHVGGLYCMSSLEGPFRGAFGKKTNSLRAFLVILIQVHQEILSKLAQGPGQIYDDQRSTTIMHCQQMCQSKARHFSPHVNDGDGGVVVTTSCKTLWSSKNTSPFMSIVAQAKYRSNREYRSPTGTRLGSCTVRCCDGMFKAHLQPRYSCSW